MQRDGYTIFCEDIRREIGGTFSLIGCLRGAIFWEGEFPFTLAKLSFAVTLTTPIAKPFEGPIELRIFMPDDREDEPAFVVGVAVPPPVSFSQPEEPPDGGDKLQSLDMQFVMSPVEIKKAGLIRVRAVVAGETIRAGTLAVLRREPASPAAGEATPQR